jgi:hypothetical protein
MKTVFKTFRDFFNSANFLGMLVIVSIIVIVSSIVVNSLLKDTNDSFQGIDKYDSFYVLEVWSPQANEDNVSDYFVSKLPFNQITYTDTAFVVSNIDNTYILHYRECGDVIPNTDGYSDYGTDCLPEILELSVESNYYKFLDDLSDEYGDEIYKHIIKL